ncbi:MAG: potassium transporter TrkG [Maricaulis sp.]|jgi:trk system potassium uptake protein TrkH|nr:potassium transporter TrkG [Maricaulis sp.]MDG2043200.1 potassium transporter TrkG [Maricaulis sp.]
MTLSAMLRPLGAIWVAIGLAAGITAIIAMALGEASIVPVFGMTAAIGAFPGGLLVLATQGVPVRARAVDALGLALFVWLTTPLIAAIPFYLSASFNMLDGTFEAFSAVTTTGAILQSPEDLPRALVFWRALLSWLGGYATLLLAAAVFAALDKDAPAIRRSVLLTIDRDNVFSHLGLAAGRIALIYATLSACIWVGLMFSGQSLFAATTLAMSALSTGGFLPVSEPLNAFLSGPGILVLGIGCLFGALNISMFWDALRDRKSLLDPDLVGVAFLVVGLSGLSYLAVPAFSLDHGFNALFAVTTSGYAVSDDVSPIAVAALFAALVGGAAASTSGGVKISRIMLLWRRLDAELSRLADPSSIAPVRFRDRSAPDRALLAIWTYVLGFSAVLGLGGVALSLTGLEFSEAFAAVAAALANAGPLFENTSEGNNWRDVSSNAKLVLIPVMVLGRLEVLAALAAVWALLRRI